ncbi:thioesterase family protein [Nocardia sp. NPDC049149]|uniref:thioesterase family protein n=1 Tax=Nocardia sp. NPDC049149 TaxID=3364315 RepID=UPI00371E285A
MPKSLSIVDPNADPHRISTASNQLEGQRCTELNEKPPEATEIQNPVPIRTFRIGTFQADSVHAELEETHVPESDQIIIGRLDSPIPKQVAGPAVCALLARELETHCPGTDFIPARLTADLFSPVLNEPIALQSAVIRSSNRMTVADASIVQRGQIRARATALFLLTAEQPPGEVWQPRPHLPAPHTRLVAPEGEPPLFKYGAAEWTDNFAAAQTADRKIMWQNLPPLIEGETISPFQRAAALGDATNLVCHWGSAGVGYINTDMTLTLSRLPEGPELGLQAQDHVASNGIAVGTATLYGRSGSLGTAVVTALANVRRQVDLAGVMSS